MNFSEYAKNHDVHPHCCGCGGCLLDPKLKDTTMAPFWCVGCMNRVKSGLPDGVKPPWLVEFNK
jgi:hypothetical protein